MKEADLRFRDKCVDVAAHVIATSPPPAHRYMKFVLHFEKADERYFEIDAPEDPDAPLPDLLPWNADYPEIHAIAVTDFN